MNMYRQHLAPFFGGVGIILLVIPGIKTLSTEQVPKKYVVNLDLPPEERWNHVVIGKGEFVSIVRKMVTTYVPKVLMPLIEKIAADLDNYIEQPYAAEMRGIARTGNCSVGDVVLATLIYDISTGCTSIVSQDERGQIWHSRNLDYDFQELLRNITIEVDFQREGKTEYSAVTFVGYVGIVSGQRPNAFTVTLDSRYVMSIVWNIIIGLLDRKTVPVALLMRNVLAHDQNFTAAVNRLSYTTTAADAYFIVGGVKPGEGAVISKGHFGPDDIWRLNSTDGRWFLVETNYDHWKLPPSDDDRRTPATKAMKCMGQRNITVEQLFHVMSTPKVLNENTVYTVVMSAAQPSLMHSWIRYTYTTG